MITIKKALQKIDKEEKTIDKIAKFLKTKRGQMFVSKLHTAPIKELRARYNAPWFILPYADDRKNMNIINHVIKKYEICLPCYKQITFEAPKYKKIQIFLTKKESKKFNIALTPRKMGFAALMHAYEEYAMDKFKTKKPAPTERQLAEDLFPDELMAGYNNMLYIHREYVRNLLCKKYGKRMKQDRFFRIFKVLSITTDPATGKTHDPVVSEVELDRPFIGDRNTPKKDIALRLKMIADSERKGDKNIIAVKLYTKYGTLVRKVNFVNI